MPTCIAAEVCYRCVAAGITILCLRMKFYACASCCATMLCRPCPRSGSFQAWNRIYMAFQKPHLKLSNWKEFLPWITSWFYSEWWFFSRADCWVPACIEMDICVWILFTWKRAHKKAVLWVLPRLVFFPTFGTLRLMKSSQKVPPLDC